LNSTRLPHGDSAGASLSVDTIFLLLRGVGHVPGDVGLLSLDLFSTPRLNISIAPMAARMKRRCHRLRKCSGERVNKAVVPGKSAE
jgi:hypothetical protein